MPKIQVSTFEGETDTIQYDRNPNECPHCHRSVTPRVHIGYKIHEQVCILYRCPDARCQEMFMAYYEVSNNGVLMQHFTNDGPQMQQYDFLQTSIGTAKGKVFSDDINRISESFIVIYNQALEAENMGLHHICGIGYRKALEFLIKDYLIHMFPDRMDDIKKKFLGNCIKEDVTNPNLKDMAERAVWLGNDETHYSKKWGDRDINDLKLLIDVTLHWIEMEILTLRYKADMQRTDTR